ncbi:MAG: DUF1186 domain-containing protein [Clostridia bacterium]|nr:DUF1186 domain-containing protein [Clostridia bacterium]
MSPELKKALQKNVAGIWLDEKMIKVIREHNEEAIPIFLNLLRNINSHEMADSRLCGLWAAFFLMAEYHVEEAFPYLISCTYQIEDMSDLGFFVTEEYLDVLYHTFNGDVELLTRFALDRQLDIYVRDAADRVLAQLYLDGIISREKLEQILRQELELCCENEEDATLLVILITDLHFYGLEDLVKQAGQLKLYDEHMMGNPLEEMFSDEYPIENFCRDSLTMESGLDYPPSKPDMHVEEAVAMSQRERLQKFLPPGQTFRPKERYALDDEIIKRNDFSDDSGEERQQRLTEELETLQKRVNILEGSLDPDGSVLGTGKMLAGRNDPCPCGSGKKYKKCCMNKDLGI